MTDGEYRLSFSPWGKGWYCTHKGQSTRLPYVVSEAFDDYGRTLTNRPDRAALCYHIADRLRSGGVVSSKVETKAKREIEAVRRLLVDGIAVIREQSAA